MATKTALAGDFGDDEGDGARAQLESAFGGVIEVSQQSPEDVAARMLTRVLGAQSLDELFDSGKGTTADQLDGHTITVESVQWSTYESQRGPIPLAIVTGQDVTTDKALEFATTAPMLTSFLYRAGQLGELPFTARIVGKQTRNGQTALNFERP